MTTDPQADPSRDAFIARLTAHLDRTAAPDSWDDAAAGIEDADDLEELDGITAALASPAAWQEPPDFRAALLASVQQQASRPDRRPEGGTVIPLRPRRARLAVAVPLAAVAAAVITLLVLGVQRTLQPGPDETFAALGADRIRAEVSVTSKPSGFEIRLDPENLPAAAPGFYYAAWLRRGPGPGDVVPIGTFHARRVGGSIVLWSGVDPAEYHTFSVTLQRAGEPPLPNSPSAHRVMAGTFRD
jgi:Anti-sigma-K factor rskA